MDDKAVKLNFDKKQLFFYDFDGIRECRSLFKKAFHIKGLTKYDFSEMISIQDSHEELASYFSFNSYEKYKVTEIRSYICFEDIDKSKENINFWINYCSSASDVKNQLFENLKILYKLNAPELLSIYDENKNPIPNSIEPLHIFQYLDQKFYYKLTPEFDYFTAIIKEKDARIKELEHEKNQSSHEQDNFPLKFLSSDQIKNIKEVKKIGDNLSGNFSEVCLTEIIEQKFTSKSLKDISVNNFKTYILKEHEIERSLDHPNTIKTHGISNGDAENSPIILYEHCIDNLENAIKKSKLSKVEKIFAIYEIAEGIKYLHHNNIIHRGLNPKNILISIEISELGISKFMSPKEQLTISMSGPIGMIHYIAPELADDENYNEKVDIYSFGVLILFILNAAKIIFDSDKKQIVIPQTFKKCTKKLINSCLSNDPKKRPDFNKICDYLQKNYINLVDLDDNEKEEITLLIEEHNKKIPSY